MSPYETRPTPRRPLAVLPLEPFLVRNSASSSAAAKPSPRRPASLAALPLQLRDMSLLPSPFLSAAQQPARPTESRPLATLYEAAPTTSPGRSRDASSRPTSSPRARLMMQEDDTQAQTSPKGATRDLEDADEDEATLAVGSSPRRLYDAFVAVANRPPATVQPAEASPRPRRKTSTSSLSAAHFVTERAHMPPPPSPRRQTTGSPRIARIARPDDEALPNWSFYQDEDEEETGDVLMTTALHPAPAAASPSASSSELDSGDEVMPLDKENTAPARPTPRSRSGSLLANLANPPGPTAASTPGPSTTPTHAPSAPTSTAAPRTPPRPISPPLPMHSPPILSAVDAAPSSFGDSGVTSFFTAAAGAQDGSLLQASTEGTDELPRKKRRSDEAGRSISIE
ncbi:hypothetical protein JCM10908_004125 [Rhodotorula pacifica]|uniref:uncharacterized protein n=1 Tax=Rhodotorula pacifica TaxID=1495444 RepID=UPI00317B957F